MEHSERKNQWETIYKTKSLNEVNWFQPTPETSLKYIQENVKDKNAKIIDIGGGDSYLVDHLLELGYTNITVLDISENAIEKAKERLGNKSAKITWIVSDIIDFKPNEKYDFWHDRAAFHFLTSKEDIGIYKKIIKNSLANDAHILMGTFSLEGPKKCSGIEIKQYSKEDLTDIFGDFTLVQSEYINHKTPFDTEQNFVFVLFKKIN